MRKLLLSLSLSLFLITTLLSTVKADDPGQDDLVPNVPGYGDNAPRVFSRLLKIKNNATLHYILLESKNGKGNNDPLTLWIGGEPGCSSKMGFLTEIGPFLLPPGSTYSDGVKLTPNPYSWNGLSNILFIDTPQGVGYNTPSTTPYIYNDANTAEDTLYGLLNFFSDLFPSFKSKSFYLAGASYAGKFIPDLALRINAYNLNAQAKINLKGILVGNGVMDFSDNALEKSQIDYMFSRNFIDPTMDKYWQVACQADPSSAGCAFFLRRYDDLLAKVNPHNIYGTCYTDPTQPQQKRTHSLTGFQTKKTQYYTQIKKCQSHKGIDRYFILNIGEFRGKNEQFVTCDQKIYTSYEKTLAGSMNEYGRIIAETTIRVHFYAGDWDDLVPVDSIVRNIQRLGMRQNGEVRYWTNTKNQHIGFKRTYVQGQRELKFWVIKGAGHEIGQQKPEVAYKLFQGFLNNFE